MKWNFLILCCLLASPSYANTHLLNHAQAAFQSMTAMYMEILSEGGTKYHLDLEKYNNNAIESLNQYKNHDSLSANKWKARWDKISPNLKAEYTNEYGWLVELKTRNDARSYMADLYVFIMNEEEFKKDQYLALMAQVQVQAIIARFFDVSSTYIGLASLSTQHLEQLDPSVASKQFKIRLDALSKREKDKTQVKRINTAKNRWEFVERSVADYSNQSAYFLVYATKNKISKVLMSIK